MKKYILLDWDGNLANTLEVWLEACRIPLKKRGLDLTDSEIASCFGVPVERFTEWGIKDTTAAINEMDALAAQMLPQVELYPDAIFVLEALRTAGTKTALITSSLRANVINVLDKYNMHHYFDIVVAYEDTKNHKPDPEPLLKALASLDGNIHDAIMIGDSASDIKAAANADIDSILFYPPEHEKFYSLDGLKSHQPTHVIADFRQVLNII